MMDKSLRSICLFITFATLGMMMIRFFTKGGYPLTGIEALYIGALSTYTVHRKALLNSSQTKRPDQFFVCVWFITTAVLYLINFLSKGHFHADKVNVLPQMTRVTLEVAGIFVLSHDKTKLVSFLKAKAKAD